LLGGKRVPVGGEGLQNLAERHIVQPRIREVRQRIEEIGRDLSDH
jgi:hypothetical protein